MSFADSNRVALRYVAESVWGTTPSTPTMQNLNLTSESFKSNINTVTSETLRSDRNVSDITTVGGGASGDMGFELRYGDLDDFIEAALGGTWTEVRASANVATITVSANVIQCDSSIMNSVVVDQMLRISTASTTANNGDYLVTAVSTTGGTARIYVNNASSGSAAAFTSEIFDANNGLVQGKILRNGTTNRSFTIEKEFSDVSSFAQYAGMRVGGMTLNFESQAILTGSFNFTGKGQSISSATIASAVTAAGSNDVMNASGNVVRVWEGSDAITGVAFQSLSIELTNNPREQAKIGSSDLAGVGLGRCEITGSLSAYFENNALITKFQNNTQTSLRFQVQDGDGNSYVFSVPNAKYTDFTVAAGGPNNDIVQDGSWGAILDSGGTYAIQIDALDA